MTLKHALVLFVALCSAGCHARFKKAAPHIEAVRPQTISVATSPTISLASSGSSVVDVVNGVRSIDVANKLARQVDLPRVNAAFEQGLVRTLGDGPPFGITDDVNRSTLQVEVMQYGLTIPQMGGQGYFTYGLRVRIYKPNNDKVYATSLMCTVPVTGADAISQVLGTRDNIGNVLDMRKAEIQGAFDEAARTCGRDLVTMMRRHAD